jgi:PAS domain S-box-containing protein
MVNKESIEERLQRAKEDLEDLRMYINELSDFLPLAILTINPLKMIININKAVESLTGYSTLEIVGEPIDILFPKKEEINKIIKEVRKKGKITKELTLISKENKEIPVSASFSVRKDPEGNLIGYFVGIAEIGELKALQEKMEEKVRMRTKELEESRRALMNMLEDMDETRRALMNILEDVKEASQRAEEEKEKTLAIITNFADGLLVFDNQNKLSLINPQAENFLDVKEKDVVGKSILELATFSTIEPIVKIVGKELKGVFRKEVEIKKNLVLEVSTIPIMREKEKLGTLVILHDVTREKEIERMKTEFVSIAAHQLRTPLSAIKWTLRMILDGDLGEITQEQREFLEKTYKSNERMINLINDLLNVTRIEEGRFLYKPVLSDLSLVVQSILKGYQEEIKKKEINLEFEQPEKKLPLVMVDLEKIQLAIQNLLENAIKYTPPGGEIKISLKSTENEVEFSIKDSGVGIPKEEQGRVFTKFFRGSNVMKMETEGSGLGLFITKNVIEAHGGKIWFESEEGKGTTFYFTLPVKKEFEEFLKEF